MSTVLVWTGLVVLILAVVLAVLFLALLIDYAVYLWRQRRIK